MRLVFSGRARRDLTEAIAFIAAENPAAASWQRGLIEETARRLTVFPALGPTLGEMLDSTRQAQVPRTPFRLVYAIRQDAIVILRVWHGAREWPSDPR